MARTGNIAGICTSPSSSPYPIEKIGDFPYPYSVNAKISRQNRDGFGQYPRGRVYLPSVDTFPTYKFKNFYLPWDKLN